MKKTDTNLYNILKERGLLYQCTDEEKLKKSLESGTPITLYEGTDQQWIVFTLVTAFLTAYFADFKKQAIKFYY